MSNMNHLKEEEQKLDSIVSTLKDIKGLLEKLVANNVVMSSNEKELTHEEENQIAVNISSKRSSYGANAQRKNKDRKLFDKEITKEEFVERLQEVDINMLVKEPKMSKSDLVLNRVIDLLELVAEQNNQILTNTSTTKKVLATEDIIYFDVSKALYKRQVGSGDYIKVAFITGDGKITFLARNENIVETPNYYSSLWYYLNEVGELRYSTFDMVNINQIYVDKSLEEGSYYVTGYIDDKGKAVYFDQYI